MGFFSSIVGGLFGGGGSKVNTTTNQDVDVTVEVTPQVGIVNEIDLSPVQKLVDHFADANAQLGDGLTALAAVELEGQNKFFKALGDSASTAALVAGGAFLVWRLTK